MNNTQNTRSRNAILHRIATLQGALGLLALRVHRSAIRKDAMSDTHLPYLREIILQATRFGLTYQQHASQVQAEEAPAGTGLTQPTVVERMSGDTVCRDADHLADNLASVLVGMTGLLGSIAEIINREPGPLRAYAAPLDQIVISLVMLGAVDLEDEPETLNNDSGEAGDD